MGIEPRCHKRIALQNKVLQLMKKDWGTFGGH